MRKCPRSRYSAGPRTVPAHRESVGSPIHKVFIVIDDILRSPLSEKQIDLQHAALARTVNEALAQGLLLAITLTG